MPPPEKPKIYHIIHRDRLASIIKDRVLWCDAHMADRDEPGTTIGMADIKERRLNLQLGCHSDVRVGDCVPFYFCPRSVMLYVIYKANHQSLSYRGGQGPILHLEADLQEAVKWARQKKLRWAFTLSNASSRYFEDRCDLKDLAEIDWVAVQASNWKDCREWKQAEFLIERSFPWKLVERVGVHSSEVRRKVERVVQGISHKPDVVVKPDWYY